MFQQQLRDFIEQRSGFRAGSRQAVIRSNGATYDLRRFPRCDAAICERLKVAGDAVHEPVTEGSEFLRGQFNWRLSLS
jgi:hypothetical protein